MDFPSIINRIYISVSCLNFLVAFGFLTLACLYRRQCFNFPTLLACNTALAVLLSSANHIAIAIYMFIWDQNDTPQIDALCAFRAYFYHSTSACVPHSFILLAIERYCKIRQFTFLKTQYRKKCLVLLQWVFDLTFTLPILFTGNMTKVASDNLCFVTLTRLNLIFYIAVITNPLTMITLIIIYRLLVRHMHQVSTRLNNNQHMRLQRDVIVLRRIVLLNSQLVLVAIPLVILIYLIIFKGDLLPNKIMRILLLMSNLPFLSMLIILLLLTPDLRQSLIECRNKFKFCRSTRNTPVQIISPTIRF
ncbi:hypothetical protein I4U23_011488 [Adineta vaga]|nr:hypothetical protein I4U23_011488 [Adineta vaga]